MDRSAEDGVMHNQSSFRDGDGTQIGLLGDHDDSLSV